MGRRSFSKPPSRTANKEYGLPLRKKAPSNTQAMEPTMGNREFGFIQNTPKKATGAMMGRAPPKAKGKTSTRSDGRKQFAPRAGKKVF